uniref:Zmp:0000001048 n=1 Tax=Cyprinodon variegatus TaxID=28743 RepID=A0A3Q2FU98_CYPVA
MGTSRVLVSGCSSGIGLAVAVRLANNVTKHFKAAGSAFNKILVIQKFDVCCEEFIKECINCLPNRQVDIPAKLASAGLDPSSAKVAAMKELFDVNLFSLMRLVKEVLPDMKQRQDGHTVVMSSVVGIQGPLFSDVYSASKFAVEGFCESLVARALKCTSKPSICWTVFTALGQMPQGKMTNTLFSLNVLRKYLWISNILFTSFYNFLFSLPAVFLTKNISLYFTVC